MTSDAWERQPRTRGPGDTPPARPWPRFTRTPEVVPPREPAPHEPWPRWGWFPQQQRSWSFAPGPPVTADASAEPAPAPPTPTPAADPAPVMEPTPLAGSDDRELDLLPVRRSTSTALVPVRRNEVTLAEVARAIRRMAPAAAVASLATAAAMTFFRRR